MSSIAIGLFWTLLGGVIDIPDGGITPWILLGIFWIGMLAWIWRDRRKRVDPSDDARSSTANGA